MKTILISVGAVVVAGLLVAAYMFSGSPSDTNTAGTSTEQGVVLPVAGQATTVPTSSNGTTMTVAGIGGAVVQTVNFIANPETVKDQTNQGYYYLGYHTSYGANDATATDNPPYIITYLSSTQYFNIALLQEPIGPVREEMQQYLIEHLGVTQNEMCQLNYMVTVPDRVNSHYAGMNLGFSFCPGAVRLAK